MTTGATPAALAAALIGPGATISGTPTFQGTGTQAATFTNAPALLGFTSGVVISSGDVTPVAYNYVGADSPTTDLSGAGYAPLDALVSQSTHDAAVLSVSFVPTAPVVQFRYVFASAEYPNYLAAFTDPAAIFLNGTAPANNIAVLPVTPAVAVTSRTVNGATNATFFNKYNTTGDALPFGGESRVLSASANVTVGQVNTITFAVADAVDGTLDSALFIEMASFVSPTPSAAGVPALSPLAFALLGIVLLLSGLLLLRGLPAASRRD